MWAMCMEVMSQLPSIMAWVMPHTGRPLVSSLLPLLVLAEKCTLMPPMGMSSLCLVHVNAPVPAYICFVCLSAMVLAAYLRALPGVKLQTRAGQTCCCPHQSSAVRSSHSCFNTRCIPLTSFPLCFLM